MRTFLDIPAGVRERIFLDAGLISGANIQLRSRRPLFTSLSTNQFEITYNLLLTCKAIYDQVKSILFAGNGIIVWHQNIEAGLKILQSLSHEQCRSLRDLYVQLYVEEALYEDDDTHSSTTLGRKQIAAWRTTARHILSRIEPGTLTMHLICDTGDSQVTRAVCQPLLEFPGKLKDCQLRIAPKRKQRLSTLAEDMVARIQGSDAGGGNKPFRFLDLPIEIRRQILQNTDLVTPGGQVCWSPSKGFYTILNTNRCREEDCDEEHRHDCRIQRCDEWNAWETGSYCRSRRSAYSSSCYCWIPPEGLMSASKIVYHEAIEVLYSHNRIIVIPSEGVNSRICPLPSLSRLDASRFITRHMWPEVLWHLRSLEIVLPILDPASCPETSSPLYLDWNFAMAHLKTHANLTQLTVAVHSSLGSNRNRPAMTDWSGESALKTHARLLIPLRTLRQVKRLFVYLEWGWHSTPRCFEIIRSGRSVYVNYAIRHKRVVGMETALEQAIMGNDYHSLAVGKAEEELSAWQRLEWNKFMY
ncbi:hypothetical protein F4821DRAFT_240264 [Hypoxylon rubiginosum]|uniref:Uncharacterized protein n=1 Tax=Hypoxylon rubiginosum TaxID=110542 RepID=A0ACC0CYU7_9PEZI|nr:hypothetical protein F4821DRAFT_240264 [Hypoxylon rubiginosum]